MSKSRELEEAIQKAAQSFGEDPITKGSIWESYLVANGFMQRLVPALLDWHNSQLKKLLAEMPKKKFIDIEIQSTLHRNIGYNQAITEVTNLINKLRSEK